MARSSRGRDPRTERQKRGDAAVLAAVEAGTLFPPRPADEVRILKYWMRLRPEARALATKLGMALGVVRAAIGVSQKELAKRIGTKQADVSRMEAGRHGLTVERLLTVLGALPFPPKGIAVGALQRARAQMPDVGRIRCFDTRYAANVEDCVEAA